MNQSKNYIPPGVEVCRVVLEKFIAAAVSYTRSISSSVGYNSYTEENIDVSQDVMINY
jgi:hypothetical protein